MSTLAELQKQKAELEKQIETAKKVKEQRL